MKLNKFRIIAIIGMFAFCIDIALEIIYPSEPPNEHLVSLGLSLVAFLLLVFMFFFYPLVLTARDKYIK